MLWFHLEFCIFSVIFFILLGLNVDAQYVKGSENVEPNIGTRQVHLDFHTSEYLEGIGEKFNKKEFQEAIKAGRINSINVFAKDWHGWSYYQTKYSAIHPHLKFDLLKEQIEACHEVNVKAPVYFAIGHAESESKKKIDSWLTANAAPFWNLDLSCTRKCLSRFD
ncbi:MAG: hypothetical protein WKF97_12455 [Chitinophagaceae bacterium]